MMSMMVVVVVAEESVPYNRARDYRRVTLVELGR